MVLNIDKWSRARKAFFLAVLTHELTISARGTYEMGTTDVSNSRLLRSYNELQHRVTASLRGYISGKEDVPLAVILEMASDFGRRHHCLREIEAAISRANEIAADEMPLA